MIVRPPGQIGPGIIQGIRYAVPAPQEHVFHSQGVIGIRTRFQGIVKAGFKFLPLEHDAALIHNVLRALLAVENGDASQPQKPHERVQGPA